MTNTNKKILLAGFAILVLSIVFRFWQLGSNPVGLYWDEIAMYVDAKVVSQTLKDMHGHSALQTIFPSYGDYKLPMYIWLASLSFKLIGASEFALRLPSAVLGVAQSVVIFLILRKLTSAQFSNKLSWGVSLLGSFIIAVSPWSVLFSRTGFEGFTGQFLVSCAFLCLLLSTRSKKWLIPSSLLAIAGVYSYYSVRFVWPVLIICFWSFFVAPKLIPLIKSPTQFLKSSLFSILPFVVCLVIWWLGISPIFNSPDYAASQQFRLSTSSILVATPYNLQSNVYRELTGNNIVSRVLYHGWFLQIQALLQNYADHFDFNFLFISGDPNLRHSTGQHGLFLLFCFPLLIAGFLYQLRKSPLQLLFFVIWWLIALLPASVPTDTPHALRSLNALTPIVIIMSFGLVPFYVLYNRIKSKPTQRAILLITLAMIGYQVFMFGADYFFVYPVKSASEWQQGYKDIVLNVDQDRQKYDKIWINPEDDRFFLWYLGYGNMGVNEIQTAMEHELILKSWQNVEFEEFPWDRHPTAVRPFIVVTRAGSLQIRPSHEKIIYDSFGQPKYEIGFYDKNE